MGKQMKQIPARIAGGFLLVRERERSSVHLRRRRWHVTNGFVVQTVTFVRCVWAIFILIAMKFLRNAFIGSCASASHIWIVANGKNVCEWVRVCYYYSESIWAKCKHAIAWYLLEFVLLAKCARRLVFGIWTILDIIASETSVNEI